MKENIYAHTLLDEAASTLTSDGHQNHKNGSVDTTYQATLSNTTTPTATVLIEVSNDNKQWILMGTITLSGAEDTDGFAATASWKHSRARVSAISGTDATVTVTMGE